MRDPVICRLSFKRELAVLKASKTFINRQQKSGLVFFLARVHVYARAPILFSFSLFSMISIRYSQQQSNRRKSLLINAPLLPARCYIGCYRRWFFEETLPSQMATQAQHSNPDKAPLCTIERAFERSVLIAAVLLPAANLHQHAEDIVGIAALDGCRVAAKAFGPDFHS